MFRPKRCFMYSPARCSPVPVPVDAKVTAVGLSLACLISSGTDLTGSAGLTTRMNGDFT